MLQLLNFPSCVNTVSPSKKILKYEMVRTRANNAAVRKAVVAKAPRKQLAPVRSVTSPSSGKSKKGKLFVGGNPAKAWPTPTWQKGIQTFLGGGSSSSSSGGECSSSSATNSGSSDSEEQPMSTVDFMSEQGSHSTRESHSAGVGVSLLDEDITQLNSDEDDD